MANGGTTQHNWCRAWQTVPAWVATGSPTSATNNEIPSHHVFPFIPTMFQSCFPEMTTMSCLSPWPTLTMSSLVAKIISPCTIQSYHVGEFENNFDGGKPHLLYPRQRAMHWGVTLHRGSSGFFFVFGPGFTPGLLGFKSILFIILY